MSKRKHIPIKVKLAAALLTIVRPDENGQLRPVIPMHKAKNMTAEEIISQFEFDHAVFHIWGGPDDPWNLTPMTKAEHRAKTQRDAKAIAKVRRAAKRLAGTAKRGRQIPGSKGTKYRKKMDGTVELRS